MRPFEVIDSEGDTVETCDRLVDAVIACPMDGAIVFDGRIVVLDDLINGPLGPLLREVRGV
jgi:hypothetical protein